MIPKRPQSETDRGQENKAQMVSTFWWHPMLQGTRDDQVHREIAKVCDQRGYRNNTLKASTVLAPAEYSY